MTPALEVSGLRRSYGGVPLAEGLWRQFRTRVLRCRQNPRDGPPRRPVALDFGIAFLLERQGGIWKRLRAAPLSRSSLLVGKALAGALVGLISVGSTFAFGIVVLGIRIQGSIPGFLLLLVSSALMASSFGLLLAALGKTPGAARGISMLAVLLLVMLGGGWVPAFVFPEWLRTVTLVLPTRWAIDGLDAVTWRGAGFVAGALSAAAVLLGSSALFLLIPRLRFRWTDE